MTAYREAADAPCHQCDRPARGPCTACQRPTCAKHFDTRDICGKCDEALYRHMRSDGVGLGVLMFAIVPVTLGAVALGLLVPPLLPVAVALPFVGFPTLFIVRKRRKRARFFRLMRERGALPEPKPEFSDADVERAKYEQYLDNRD